jgi:hypothetical protein
VQEAIGFLLVLLRALGFNLVEKLTAHDLQPSQFTARNGPISERF